MTTTRTLLRYAALTLAVVALTLSASAGIKSPRLLTKIAQNTPAPVIVDKGSEMKLAEKSAKENGGTALWGIGHSMEPLYAPGTAVVVKEIGYDDIKKGMTLVYRKANGGLVAHSVIDEDRRGYVVQGVNNDEPDAVSVNEKNIVGVIVAAYSANTGGFHQTMAMNNTKNAKVVAMR
ncbi:MAG: signal peptidase I [Opitutae bacterium]|nr:signal peptidase I [Opitutae bacterium]